MFHEEGLKSQWNLSNPQKVQKNQYWFPKEPFNSQFLCEESFKLI